MVEAAAALDVKKDIDELDDWVKDIRKRREKKSKS